jgi:threonine/homoserine/homoserine lactone efflux protein
MIDLSSYLSFVIAALVLIVVPGPAVLYVVARSVNRGRLAGFVSVLGIGTGSTNNLS